MLHLVVQRGLNDRTVVDLHLALVIDPTEEREVDWADGTTTELAKSGHLELLIWARQNGASWEEETFPCVKYTRGLGRIRRYLRDEGCPGSSSEDPDNADVDWMD